MTEPKTPTTTEVEDDLPLNPMEVLHRLIDRRQWEEKVGPYCWRRFFPNEKVEKP